jgi:transketolase C-terminal domain/subunit
MIWVPLVVTLEDHVIDGGFGSAALENRTDLYLDSQMRLCIFTHK